MRIERENGEDVGSVWATLTPEEAAELFDALGFYLDGEEPRDPRWHAHIGADDSELTVAIETAKAD